jgi:hypothetical protein
MSGYSLAKGLPVGEAAEVEGRTPSIFVEVSGKIVIAGWARNSQSRSILDNIGYTISNTGIKGIETYCRVSVAYSFLRA